MKSEFPVVKDRELQDILDRIGKRISIDEDAKKTAEPIRKSVAPDGKSPPEQGGLALCPMPTDMCRVSPFFPIVASELQTRDLLRNIIITQSSWGEIQYTGPRLSVYDEDVLFAILVLIDNIRNRKKIATVEEKEAYTYIGSLLPILRLLGYKKYGKSDYKRILDTLELMTVAGLKFSIYGKNQKGERKITQWHMSALLVGAHWNELKKELTVTVNPYFYECIGKGTITLLDIRIRASLKSVTAKSLYRFMQSHRADFWEGHFLTVATALNMDIEQPQTEIRRTLKRAILELIKKEVFNSKSKLEKDIIKLYRRNFEKSHSQELLK